MIKEINRKSWYYLGIMGVVVSCLIFVLISCSVPVQADKTSERETVNTALQDVEYQKRGALGPQLLVNGDLHAGETGWLSHGQFSVSQYFSTNYGTFFSEVGQDLEGKLEAGKTYEASIELGCYSDIDFHFAIETTIDGHRYIFNSRKQFVEGRGSVQNPFVNMTTLTHRIKIPKLGTNTQIWMRFKVVEDIPASMSVNFRWASLKEVIPSYVTANGTDLMLNGQPYTIKSVCFANDYEDESDDFDKIFTLHHREQDFENCRDMGFNTIRFAINGDWFDDDVSQNTLNIWSWLDDNVEWAVKYDLKLIIDMHLPVGANWLDTTERESTPINSTDWLWNSEAKLTKFKNIWREIATRYKDESAIVAYEILNEPVTVDSDGSQWTDPVDGLAQQTIDVIRAVDPDHLIVVDALAGINREYIASSPGLLLNDDNLLYDFHFYEPFTYTHQGSIWTDAPLDGGSYPDASYPCFAGELDWDNDYVDHIYTQSQPGPTAYQYGTFNYKITDPSIKVGQIAMVTKGDLQNGTVYFDKLTLLEIAPDGSSQVIKEINISEDQLGMFYHYGDSDDKFIKVTGLGLGDNACLAIKGAKTTGYDEAVWDSEFNWFFPKYGYSYSLSGYMATENFPASGAKAYLKLAFFSDSLNKVYTRDKPYLAELVKPWATFSQANNIPVSCLEFGLMKYCFENNKGGQSYVTDVISLLNANNMGYSYWNYHGRSMGIYVNDLSAYPTVVNESLYNILIQCNTN